MPPTRLLDQNLGIGEPLLRTVNPVKDKKFLKYIPCLGQHPQFITLFMKKDKMHSVLF